MAIRQKPDEYEATRQLRLAAQAIHEACEVFREYAPPDDDPSRDAWLWRHQVRKLKMAKGICENVKALVDFDVRFKALRVFD